ncbi:MAG: hypothetical protein ACRER4_01885 [Steroidobacteraceae bacterium]
MRGDALMLSCQQCWTKPSVRQLAGMHRRRRNRGLGAEDRSDFDLAGNLLRDANQKLKAIEAQLRSQMPTPGTQNLALGEALRKLLEARQRYNSLVQAYIYAYGIAFGPPDTSGLELGQWQVYVISGVAIGVIVAAAYELNKYLDVLGQQAQTQATQSQTAQDAQKQAAMLQDQAAAAYSAGDATRGDQLTALARQQAQIAQATGGGGASESFTQWITRNAGWVAAGAAAVFLVPKLIR